MISRRSYIQGTTVAIASFLVAPHVSRAAGRKLRVGHNNSLTSSFHAGALAFQKYLTEKGEGRFDVEIFPSAQLGDEIQMTKSVADGALDLFMSPMTAPAGYVPEFSALEFPYLFSNAMSARNALDGALGTNLAESMVKHSFEVLAFGENGVRHMTANKAVRGPSDLNGLKLRVQPSRLHIEAFRLLGADAAPLPFPELPEALRTGKFEAQENPISLIVANDWMQRSQSHISLTGHVYSPIAILFSKDVFEELSGSDRVLVRQAGRAASVATRDVNDEALKSGVDKLKAAGMTVVSDVDTNEFQKRIAAHAERLAQVIGTEAYARVRNLVT